MTEQEIAELRSWLRSFPFSGSMTGGQVAEAAEKCLQASIAIGSLQADLANCERRAEDAEARNVFLETEIVALAEKVKKP